MQLPKNVETKTVTVAEHEYVFPVPYTPEIFNAKALNGLGTPEVLAKKMNQTLIEDLRNNWASRVKKAVEEKKEVFYRFMLPLVLHANEMVMNRRDGLLRAQRELDSGPVSADSLALLRRLVLLLPGFDEARATALAADDPELPGVIDDLLRRCRHTRAGKGERRALWSKLCADDSALRVVRSTPVMQEQTCVYGA